SIEAEHSAKVWWHRDLAPAHTSRAATPPGGQMRTNPPRTHAHELPHAEPGATVRLQGWVHRRRELAACSCLVVRDRTGLAQVVVKDGAALPPEETPVEVVGTATPNP